MQIQSIELFNFRQFQHCKINFSVDKNKNVTLILGDNGTGKTTIAQAFNWCFYGETTFSNKNLLNRNRANYLLSGDSVDVSVIICLEHEGKRYKIIRRQEYRYKGNVITAVNTKFDIQVTDEKGNSRWIGNENPRIKDIIQTQEINSIMPRDLSRYFFFDGEKIETISKQIASGKKSDNFVNAVNALTGLKTTLKALDCLKPSSKNSVIGILNAEYLRGGSERIRELTSSIEELTTQLNRLDETVLENKTEMQRNYDSIRDWESKIKQYKEAAALQTQKEFYEKEIVGYENNKYIHLDRVFSLFSTNFTRFICMSPLKQALLQLNNSDFKGKDIPNLHSKTIEALLKRKQCICGTFLEEGDAHYRCLQQLIEYLPPQSIAVTIGNFVSNAKVRNQGSFSALDEIDTTYNQIYQQDEMIEKNRELISKIDSKLTGENARQQVKDYTSYINQCRLKNEKLNRENFKLTQKKGELKNELKHKLQERSELAIKDQNNRRIELIREYSVAVYNKLESNFVTKQKMIREKLQKYINEYFVQFFNGAISLNISDGYRVEVVAKGKFSEIETSTGQGIAVIFAFLAAIIRIAKENSYSSEEYPVVMDAPLSTLDNERIKSVCNILPNIADQVIIFIKDTDGAVAEQYLNAHIGQKLTFYMIDQFTTEVR